MCVMSDAETDAAWSASAPDTQEMVLQMACPTKRKGSDNRYYRRTIPAPASKRPRNWYKTHIAISLSTADRNAAKAKCPGVASVT